MLLFGLLWPHSVLNGNLFLPWNPIHTLSSWHHPRFVRPQRLQLLAVVKKSSRDKILLEIRLFLWAFLWTFLWAFCCWPGMTATWHLVSGWHPFFFRDWKNAEVLALCRGCPTFGQVVNLHLFWAFDVSRSGSACLSFLRDSSPLAIAVYRSALDHGRIQRLQGRSLRRSFATM